MKRIAIFPRREPNGEVSPRVFEGVHPIHNIDNELLIGVVGQDGVARLWGKDEPLQEKPDGVIDFVIACGGDGTILRAIEWVFQNHYPGLPVVGVNKGNMGFLAAYDSLWDAFNLCRETNPRFESRFVMEIEGNDIEKPIPFFNDIYIAGTGPATMISVRLYDGEQEIISYRTDNLIICTPTGSTAYNLSAGGPVLAPTLDAYAITPIAAIGLGVRPFVRAGTEVTRVVVETDHCLFINGQTKGPSKGPAEYLVKASNHRFFLSSPHLGQLRAMKEKMGFQGES